MTPSAASNDIRRDLVALLPRLRRFALTLTGDTSTADGLVESGCARAIQKSHLWRGEGRLESWVFTIMRSLWSDDRRREGRQDRLASHTGAEGKDDADRSAILCLPPGLSSTILLADIEGFSYPEAASILGISTDVFAKRLCAGRLKLSSMSVAPAERRA